MNRKIPSTNWFGAPAITADRPVTEAPAATVPTATPPTPDPVADPALAKPPRRNRSGRADRDPAPSRAPIIHAVGAPRRRQSVWWRAATLVMFVAVLASWFVWLRPTWMGGSASVLTVRGVSMEPTYRYGDVIIAHPRSSYEIGDIIAFRVPEGDVGAGTVVIHRIVGGDASTGFVTQGDNNPDPDEWRPGPADILGAARWRIPALGRLMSLLHSVAGIAMVAGLLAAGLVVFGFEDPNPRRRRRGVGGPDHPGEPTTVPAVEPPAAAHPMPVAATPNPPQPGAGSDPDPLDDLIALPPLAMPAPEVEPAAQDPLDDLIVLPPPAGDWFEPDHVVTGEHWGDLQHLAIILKDRGQGASLFDDGLEEVSAHSVPGRRGPQGVVRA